MKKYIEAEAFKRELIDNKSFYPAIVNNALENMQAADVKEIIHAEWEIGFFGKMCRCSHCKEEFDYEHNDITHDWYYCPACGSDMGLG